MLLISSLGEKTGNNKKKGTYSHLHIDLKLVSSVAKEGQENCVSVLN